MRIACLWVPDFLLQALRRSEPELAEAPLAIAAGPLPRDPIVTASAEAAELGVRPGMTAAQARQVAPAALVRVTPLPVAVAADEALADAAAGFSPRVKRNLVGEVFLDAGGLLSRFGFEEAIAHELLRRCRRVGLEARVGVASNLGVARVAARYAGRWTGTNGASGNSLPASAGGTGGHEAAEGVRGAAGPPATDRTGLATGILPNSGSHRGSMDTPGLLPPRRRFAPPRGRLCPACGGTPRNDSDSENGRMGCPRIEPAGVGAGLAPALAGDAVVVRTGEESVFLDPLPLGLLQPALELEAMLARWGLATAGELARLPRREVGLRLGLAGLALHRLASGEEVEAFVPDPLREVLREAVALDDPLEALEPFLFVANGILSRLAQRLELRGEGFAEVLLELRLEGAGTREYRLKLVAPTRDVPAVLALARLQLEAHPPGAPMEAVAALVTPGRVRLAQGSLFGAPLPAPGKLSTALARLAALVGPERVGAPAVPDTHRPGVWTLAPFVLPESNTTAEEQRSRGAEGKRQFEGSKVQERQGGRGAEGQRGNESSQVRRFEGSKVQRQQRGRGAEEQRKEGGALVSCPSAPLPLGSSAVTKPDSLRPALCALRPVLRAFRPPRAAKVDAVNGRPVVVWVEALGGIVVGWGGPYRFVGEWWDDDPFVREDFDVATTDGSLLRVYFDRLERRWFVDGIYD
jgi:nucleotidyltransferase/DNA polymerase involved in DNA repair